MKIQIKQRTKKNTRKNEEETQEKKIDLNDKSSIYCINTKKKEIESYILYILLKISYEIRETYSLTRFIMLNQFLL